MFFLTAPEVRNHGSPPLARNRRRAAGCRAAGAPLTVMVAVAAITCGGCASGSSHPRANPAPPAASTATVRVAGTSVPPSATPACVATVVSTVAAVARRAYQEAATGRIVAQAQKRVEQSQALAGAVARGDVTATRAAVAGLQAHQIPYLQVMRGHRVLVRVGHGPGIAPAGGSLLDATGRQVGRYVLSIQGTDGYALTTAGLTGAQVVVRRGSRQLYGTLRPGPASIPDAGQIDYGGVTYEAVSFGGQVFPAGALRISVLVAPQAFRLCAATRDQTVANVYGRLAQAIYAGERGGLEARIAVHVIGGSRGFAGAVAAGDAAGCSAAIQGFFASSLHIVRVRALRGSRRVCDLGGPYALAPLRGTLRRGGRVIGSFLTSVQDDLGFVLLVTRYTGVQLVLRDARGEIPSSTINPAPSLPARGAVTVRGRSYQVFSFTAQRFPSGPLRVWLLVPRTGR